MSASTQPRECPCAICGTPTAHYHRRCEQHPVHLFPTPGARAQSPRPSRSHVQPSDEERLHERMVLEVATALYTALGDAAVRVALEAVHDVLADPHRDVRLCFFAALLIAHHDDGADWVGTARALELADDCAGAVERVAGELERVQAAPTRGRGRAQPVKGPGR